MQFVKASPNNYLVVGRRGCLVNRGIAGSAILWPGRSHALIPSTKQEALFTMIQETTDGIPLRFKGIVIYRILDPVAAAQLFDFTGGDGHEAIKEMLAHVCLGELRAVVAHMTMLECIEQRKTTLTDAIASALEALLKGGDAENPERGWGIDLDVVQVAQVFIVDDELRRYLQAERRNQIRATSQLSDLQTTEELRRAGESSARILEREALETAREKNDVEREKLRLQQELRQEAIEANQPIELLRVRSQEEVTRAEILSKRTMEEETIEANQPIELLRVRSLEEVKRAEIASKKTMEEERIEAESPIRRLALKRRKEELEIELEMLRLAQEVEAVRVEKEMLEPTAQQVLRMEMLPVEQVTDVARSMSDMFKGANLSLYGEDAKLLGTMSAVLEHLGSRLRNALGAEGGSGR